MYPRTDYTRILVTLDLDRKLHVTWKLVLRFWCSFTRWCILL